MRAFLRDISTTTTCPQAAVIKKAWGAQRDFVLMASKCKKPDQAVMVVRRASQACSCCPSIARYSIDPQFARLSHGGVFRHRCEVLVFAPFLPCWRATAVFAVSSVHASGTRTLSRLCFLLGKLVPAFLS